MNKARTIKTTNAVNVVCIVCGRMPVHRNDVTEALRIAYRHANERGHEVNVTSSTTSLVSANL